jgi:hypothetical protein
MKTYKNISDKDLMLPNIGVVKAGENIDTEKEISNKNFELVLKEKNEKDIKKVK